MFRLRNNDNGSNLDDLIVRLSADLCENIDLGKGQLRIRCSDEK